MKKITYLILTLILSSSIFAQSFPADGTSQSFVAIKGVGINNIGQFGEVWESAAGFYISYATVYSSHWSLNFQAGYQKYKENDQYEFAEDPSFFMIPLQVGGRYYILLDRIRPFLAAMNGLNIISRKFVVLGEEEDVGDDRTTVQYNWQVGAGVSALLFSNLEIEATFMYNSHLLEPSIPINLTGLEYLIGFNWRLNN